MKNNNLIHLLDFSNVKNQDQVFLHARKISEELMLNWQIRSAQGTLHSIVALEFYLIIPHIFEDDSSTFNLSQKKGATHKRPEQLSKGQFYVHTKSKTIWTPPTFNRHGIDITCGNADKLIYGGILLRHLGGTNHKDGSGRSLRVIVRGNDGHLTVSPTSKKFGWTDLEKNY